MIRAVKKIRWGERAAIRWLWVGFSVEVTWRQRSEWQGISHARVGRESVADAGCGACKVPKAEKSGWCYSQGGWRETHSEGPWEHGRSLGFYFKPLEGWNVWNFDYFAIFKNLKARLSVGWRMNWEGARVGGVKPLRGSQVQERHDSHEPANGQTSPIIYLWRSYSNRSASYENVG